MVISGRTSLRVDTAVRVVGIYVVVAVGTVLALLVMAGVAPRLATDEAWGHAVVVALFAVLLPVRLAAARRGSRRAWTAMTIIAVVLAVVNIVEAVLPQVFPGWMRVEMVAIAVLMAVLAVACGRLARADRRRPGACGS